MWRCLILALCLVCAGCRSGTLPDPNDPADVDQVSPEILRGNLKAVSDNLLDRRTRREIDNQQYRDLLAKAANELVNELKLKAVDPSQAWEFAEVLRAARRWEAAKELLKTAVRHAKSTRNEDRRINDTLRLAHVQAELGEVKSAIETAKETLDARPSDSAPILPAVFFEIVPAARNEGVDFELAQLLEAAILKHLRTHVNPDTPEGRDFLIARPYHVRNAYTAAAQLYDQAGYPELAEEARRKAARVQENFDAFTQSLLTEQAGKKPSESQTPETPVEAPPRS